MARDDIELAPGIWIICADCKEVLPDIGLMDAVVTDPPYGLSFMGKKWDYDIPSVEIWQAILECLKPGGHLLAFAGTRTQHRMACAIEDAGFNIRDCIMWHYGSGFPKSLDVSKAIDRMAGAERTEVIGKSTRHGGGIPGNETSFAISPEIPMIYAPATEVANQWSGWGTALKPATEIITMARKPLDNCTVAENVIRHGTGGINVDGCRISMTTDDREIVDNRSGAGYGTIQCTHAGRDKGEKFTSNNLGRWPANLIHDGSEEVLRLFPNAGGGFGVRGGRAGATVGDYGMGATMEVVGYGDTGSAARFFYTAKASKSDRDEGCEGLEERGNNRYGEFSGTNNHAPKTQEHNKSHNHHPTVKPVDLMRYLCRLITPPKGIILDPFMGSGSTGKAAIREGFKFIGIERDREYFEIARKRIEAELKQGRFDF